MFTNLTVFEMAHAMAVHAGQRQAVIAQNLAHADTPGYRGQDIRPFAESYRGQVGTAQLRSTRAGHLAGATSHAPSNTRTAANWGEPNNNSVSIEREMLKAVDVKRQHDRAVTIYKASMGMLRATLAR